MCKYSFITVRNMLCNTYIRMTDCKYVRKMITKKLNNKTKHLLMI